EHGKVTAVRERLPRERDGHSHADLTGIAADDVRHHAYAFLEVDERDDVRPVVGVAPGAGHRLDAVRVDGPRTGDGSPFDRFVKAIGAHEARVPDRPLAPRAPGQDEAPLARRVPERSGVVIDLGLVHLHNVASVPSTTVT